MTRVAKEEGIDGIRNSKGKVSIDVDILYSHTLTFGRRLDVLLLLPQLFVFLEPLRNLFVYELQRFKEARLLLLQGFVLVLQL